MANNASSFDDEESEDFKGDAAMEETALEWKEAAAAAEMDLTNAVGEDSEYHTSEDDDSDGARSSPIINLIRAEHAHPAAHARGSRWHDMWPHDNDEIDKTKAAPSDITPSTQQLN